MPINLFFFLNPNSGSVTFLRKSSCDFCLFVPAVQRGHVSFSFLLVIKKPFFSRKVHLFWGSSVLSTHSYLFTYPVWPHFVQLLTLLWLLLFWWCRWEKNPSLGPHLPSHFFPLFIANYLYRSFLFVPLQPLSSQPLFLSCPDISSLQTNLPFPSHLLPWPCCCIGSAYYVSFESLNWPLLIGGLISSGYQHPSFFSHSLWWWLNLYHSLQAPMCPLPLF